jgi:thiosulfate/3-mercaptopyruvate sulfurtransferase
MVRVRIFVGLLLCSLGCSGLESYEGSMGAQPGASSASGAEPAGAAPDAVSEDAAGDSEVFVSVARLQALSATGVTLLDARPGDGYTRGHVPGAHHTPWERFVDGDQTGLLSDDLARIGSELSRVGVSADRPVVVYGEWDGAWGEEGRIYWMLEYLGHRDVHVLEGGVGAWQRAGHALTSEVPADGHGDFMPQPRPELRATAEQVQQALERGDAVILDIRTLAEYDGLTPHGSERGGHIPEAVHYHWRDVFGESGALLPRDRVRARLSELGIGDDTLVIAYCTGGVRSGFMFAVMRWAGYARPRNYDGSFWEWSSRKELPVAR